MKAERGGGEKRLRKLDLTTKTSCYHVCSSQTVGHSLTCERLTSPRGSEALFPVCFTKKKLIIQFTLIVSAGV